MEAILGFKIGETIHETPLHSLAYASRLNDPNRYVIKLCRPHPAFVDARSIPDLIIQFIAAVDLQRQVAERSPRWAPIHAGGLLPDDEGAYFVGSYFRTSVERMINGRALVTAGELSTIVSAILGALDDLEITSSCPHGNLKASNVLIDRIGGNDSRIVVTDPLSTPPAATGATSAVDLYALGNLISQLVLFEPVVGDGGVLVPSSAAWNRLGAVGERWRVLCQRLVSPDRTSRLTKLSELFPLLPSVGIHYDRRESLAKTKPPAAPLPVPAAEPRVERSIFLEKTPWSTEVIAPAETPRVIAQPAVFLPKKVVDKVAKSVQEEKPAPTIRSENSDPAPYIARGYSAAEKKQNAKALSYFQQAVAARADDSAALLGRGYAHALTGHLVEAAADFTTALSLDAECITALLNRATVQAALENQSKAASDFLSASERARAEPIARLSRAKYRLTMGDSETAAEEIAVAIKLLASDPRWRGLLLPDDLAKTLRQEPAEPARELNGQALTPSQNDRPVAPAMQPRVERRVWPASVLMLVFAIGGTLLVARFPLETARFLSTRSADGGPFLSAWQTLADDRPLEFCVGCAATFATLSAMISLLVGLRLPRTACLALLASLWFLLPGMVTVNFQPSQNQPARLIHATLQSLSVRSDPLDRIQQQVFDTLHQALNLTHGSSILLGLILLGIPISLLSYCLDRRLLPAIGALLGLFVGSVMNSIAWSDGWPGYLLFEMFWTLFGFALFTICFGWRRLSVI